MTTAAKTARTRRSSSCLSSPTLPIVLVLVLFFTWGFLTALNDVLVTTFRNIFHLSYHRSTLVQFVYYSACLCFSFIASRIVLRHNYRPAMVLGLGVMSAATVLFAIASGYVSFPAFLLALAIMAIGSTQLQTAAGPYISLLGSEESAPSRFSLALGINSLGAMLAPPFGAWFILSLMHGNASTKASTLRAPYLCIAASLTILAVVVSRTDLPPISSQVSDDTRSGYRELIGRHPFVLFGVFAMVVYVGAEISIGSLLINYLTLPTGAALPYKQAGSYAALYNMGAMLGRFAGAYFLLRLRPTACLAWASAIASVLVAASLVTSGFSSAMFLLAIGLCNSIMVPIIFTTTISGLGTLTSAASGLLVAALVGGAVVPLLQGSLADAIGLHFSFLLPGCCYLIIFGYALALILRQRRICNRNTPLPSHK